MDCECIDWACEDVKVVQLSGHHPRCPKYREIVFWDCRESEYLTHTDPDEAIEDLLSDGGETPDDIEVTGYARMKNPSDKVVAGQVIEFMLKSVLCDLCDPDGTIAGDTTAKMTDAAEKFAREFLEDFIPWACEKVITYKINVRAWMKENRPDWLEDLEESEESQ